MENSSPLQISQDSPIEYRPDGFRPGQSVLGVLGLAVVIGIALLVSAIAVFFLMHGDQRAILSNTIPLTVAIQGVLDVIGIIYLAIVVPRIAKTTMRGLGFTAPSLRQIGIAISGALAMIIVVNGCGALINSLLHSNHQQAAIQLFLAEKDPAVKAAFAVLAIVVAPIAEEFAFRVFIFNAVRRHAAFWIAAAVSGICFGIAHMDPYAFVPLVLGGAILCGVYTYSKNAYMSMITHGLFNSVSVIGLYFFPNLVK